MSNGNKLHGTSEKLKRQIERIKSDLSEEDQEAILKFKDKAYSQANLSDTRVLFYLQKLYKISNEWTEKELTSLSKEDLEELVGGINQKDYSEWTKHGYKTTIRKFYQVMNGHSWSSEEYPDKVDWINPNIKKNNRNKLRREDMLSQDEALDIVSQATNKRDKAMIHLLWEGGLRSGELLNMRVKHIELDDKENEGHAIIPQEGKTGTRRILIVSSAPAIREWLEVHPNSDKRNAWLWEKLNDPEDRISYQMLRRLLKKYAKRAEVEKPVNPHNWRHSRVTFCLRFMTDAEARKFFGWAKDSDTLSRYDHLVDKDVDSAVRSMYGKAEKEVEKPKTTKVCKMCGYENTPEVEYCQNCNSQLFSSEFPPWLEKYIQKGAEDFLENKREELKQEIMEEMKEGRGN